MVAAAEGTEVPVAWVPMEAASGLPPPSPGAAAIAAGLTAVGTLLCGPQQPRGGGDGPGLWLAPGQAAAEGAAQGGDGGTQKPLQCPTGYPSHIRECRAKMSARRAHLPLPAPVLTRSAAFFPVCRPAVPPIWVTATTSPCVPPMQGTPQGVKQQAPADAKPTPARVAGTQLRGASTQMTAVVMGTWRYW